ncbi:MAG: glycosyltransferase [Lachnospiraceae bacterium]|nr:glycosyltransferase [Lachnospiraceae bacterium]
MLTHTFAVCAYKDSPYLETCIRSLKKQTVFSAIIVCTSTPSSYIRGIAEKYELPYFVREGKSDIQSDWNFAYEQADSQLVTIAHQDDYYHRDYARMVQECWRKYRDTTVFTTDCVIIKGKRIQRPGLFLLIKKALRMPLRIRRLASHTFLKQAVLIWGNPVICPSATYNKEELGMPLFASPYKFALDWDTLWKLAKRPGRFICVEKPLIGYRIHEGATTKDFIDSHRRSEEELAMYQKIWPRLVAKGLMAFYRKAYGVYR